MFCSMHILITLQQCGMTSFDDLTTTNLFHDMLLKQKIIECPSPFNKKTSIKVFHLRSNL